jgi:hypothetical protein
VGDDAEPRDAAPAAGELGELGFGATAALSKLMGKGEAASGAS